MSKEQKQDLGTYLMQSSTLEGEVEQRRMEVSMHGDFTIDECFALFD